MSVETICIAGEYHKGNLGDDILMRAFQALFADRQLRFRWIGELSAGDLAEDCCYLIIGGGSHWPNRFIESLANERIPVPYSFVGVSARHRLAWRPTMRILRKARHVVLRDRASIARLYFHPRITLAPDLSWLCPLDPAPEREGRELTIGLNLRFWPRNKYDAEAIVQTIKEAGAIIKPLPFFCGDPQGYSHETRWDQKVLSDAGVPSPAQIVPDDIRECDMVVGMRYHSLVLAAQAGIPFIGFDDHPKTIAFYKETGLGKFSVPLSKPQALRIALDQAVVDYDKIRTHLEKVRRKKIQKANKVYETIRNDIINTLNESERD